LDFSPPATVGFFLPESHEGIYPNLVAGAMRLPVIVAIAI
jgi:hypothetical protein